MTRGYGFHRWDIAFAMAWCLATAVGGRRQRVYKSRINGLWYVVEDARSLR